MTLRHALIALLLLTGLPAPAVAASRPAETPRRHVGAVRKPVHPAPAGRSGAPPRTLEDIHIEGEIPVPQVLFITARDQRRFMEFQHGRYLRTSRKLGEETVLPSWIVVTGTRPAQDRGSSR